MWRFILFSWVILSCQTPSSRLFPPESPVDFFDSRPVQQELIVIGVAGARISERDSLQAALEDAALKVALYEHSVSGTFRINEKVGDSFLDFVIESEGTIDFPPAYTQYIAQLKYDPDNDILREDGLIFVRARYDGSSVPSIDWNLSKNWIKNPPRFKDFLVGVGCAYRINPKDSYIGSYQNAFLAIVRSADTRIYAETVETQGSFNRETGSVSQSSLSNFYIIAVQKDKDGKVYTLAIAKK
ncbi:MAG: hypothetical protein LBQ77_00380 [Treponema sp.]|jgi:hypothetical protein|nr:hypothetical protein [Treponema sp.]